MFSFKKIAMPSPAQALPGRDHAIRTASEHFVNHHALKGPYPAGLQQAMFGLGCFWGAERKFWELGDGIYVTAVGYAGGVTPNPIYEEVCSGRTGHNEVVLVVYDPAKISYETLLQTFWESHDPTQGMRQGNDVGTSYRSAIYYTSDEQRRVAEDTIADVDASGLWPGKVVTEVAPAGDFWEAEPEHQDYLLQNPGGYTCHFIRADWTLPRRKQSQAG